MYRQVKGFHGGPAERVTRIVDDPPGAVDACRAQFKLNDYPWFGPGMYFHEENRERAESWAEQQYADRVPSVVCAQLDLTDDEFGIDLGRLSDREEFLEAATIVSTAFKAALSGDDPDPALLQHWLRPDGTSFLQLFQAAYQQSAEPKRDYLLDGFAADYLATRGIRWLRALVFTEENRYHRRRDAETLPSTMDYTRQGMKGWRSRVIRDVCAFVVVYHPSAIHRTALCDPND